MKIKVCLEVGPQGKGAFVPEGPGSWVFGRAPERALEKERLIVREWFNLAPAPWGASLRARLDSTRSRRGAPSRLQPGRGGQARAPILVGGSANHLG